MTPSSEKPAALSVLAEGAAPHVTRARIYGQASAPVETYRIVETFPHDVEDYTEGLFIHDGYLYEATGEYGKSRLKKSNLVTGEVICECALDLDTNKVDWPEIVRRSIFRELPFVPVEENEKGFRDALVIETFCQFLDTVPKEASKCLVYLVSKDGRLREAAEQRTRDRDNVRVFETLDDLRSQLNALNFEVADVEELLPLANAAFFTDGESLYPKYVYYQIFEVNSAVIASKPRPEAIIRVIGTSIDQTTFISKAGTKFSFQTKVRVKVEAFYKNLSSDYYYSTGISPGSYISATSRPSSAYYYATDTGAGTYFTSTAGSNAAYPISPSTGHYIISPSTGTTFTDVSPASAVTSVTTAASPVVGLWPQGTKVRIGIHTFAVDWEATHTHDGKLKDPKLIRVRHIDTEWEEA